MFSLLFSPLPFPLISQAAEDLSHFPSGLFAKEHMSSITRMRNWRHLLGWWWMTGWPCLLLDVRHGCHGGNGEQSNIFLSCGSGSFCCGSWTQCSVSVSPGSVWVWATPQENTSSQLLSWGKDLKLNQEKCIKSNPLYGKRIVLEQDCLGHFLHLLLALLTSQLHDFFPSHIPSVNLPFFIWKKEIENNSPCLMELSWGLNEITHEKDLAHRMALIKCSVGVSSCTSQEPFATNGQKTAKTMSVQKGIYWLI